MRIIQYLLIAVFISTTISFDKVHAEELAAEEVRSVADTGFNRAFSMHPLGRIWHFLDESAFLNRQEWWGFRKKLEEKGIIFDIVYTGDFVNNTSGGSRKGSAFMGNLDLIMSVDTAKAGLWEHGAFNVYGLYNFGNERASGKFVGDAQGVDNIDAPRLFKLFEFWYEHMLMEDQLSLRAGLYNLNSEFANTEYGGLFLNSSFGMDPSIALNTTASIFPLTGPAFRIKWDPISFLTLQAAILSGNPGDEDSNPHGLDIAFNKKRGNMVVGEVQFHADVPLPLLGALPGTLKLGAWNNSNDVDDVSDTDTVGDPVKHDDNHGVYAVIDQKVFKEKDSEDQGLGVFLQYGQVPYRTNSYTNYLGLGVNYLGLIPTRDEDSFGVAFNRLSTGRAYSTSDYDKYEDVIEVVYLIQLTKAIVIQPDFQIVRNPNADPSLKDAKVFTVRTKISF